MSRFLYLTLALLACSSLVLGADRKVNKPTSTGGKSSSTAKSATSSTTTTPKKADLSEDNTPPVKWTLLPWLFEGGDSREKTIQESDFKKGIPQIRITPAAKAIRGIPVIASDGKIYVLIHEMASTRVVDNWAEPSTENETVQLKCLDKGTVLWSKTILDSDAYDKAKPEGAKDTRGKPAFFRRLDNIYGYPMVLGGDGNLYIGAMKHQKGEVGVYSITDGSLIRIINCPGTSTADRPLMVLKDGTAYISSWKGLHCTNPDGTQKWIHLVGPERFVLSGPSINKDGTIYIYTGGGPHDYTLVALEPEKGAVKWSYLVGTGNTFNGGGAIVLTQDGNIFYSGPGGRGLIKLDPSGKLLFESKEANGSPLIDTNGTLICRSVDGGLARLDQEGKLLSKSSGVSQLFPEAILENGNILCTGLDQVSSVIICDKDGKLLKSYTNYRTDAEGRTTDVHIGSVLLVHPNGSVFGYGDNLLLLDIEKVPMAGFRPHWRYPSNLLESN